MCKLQAIDLGVAKLEIHVVLLHEDGPGSEELEEEDLSAATHWILPAKEFYNLWDSLVFDEDIKGQVITGK